MNRPLRLIMISVLACAGCGGTRLSHDEIRKQIASIGNSSLIPQAVAVRRVVSESDKRAIAETTVDLAVQFERDTVSSPWHAVAVRLGSQNWVSIDELVTALNESRRRATVESFQKLAAGVASYRERNGTAPAAADIRALTDILHPQYMKDLIRDDAWGHPIELDSGGPPFRFRSLGPDGRRGTSDDLLPPE